MRERKREKERKRERERDYFESKGNWISFEATTQGC